MERIGERLVCYYVPFTDIEIPGGGGIPSSPAQAAKKPSMCLKITSSILSSAMSEWPG